MKLPKVLLSLVGVDGALVAAVAMAASSIALKQPPEKRQIEEKAVSVEVQRVEAGPVEMSVIEFGTARAKTDLLLTAQVSGRVVETSPRLWPGESAPAGELLLRIDPRPYALAVQSAEALVKQAEKQLAGHAQEKENAERELAIAKQEAALAERALERARKLFRARSESERARDVAEEAWLNRRSRVQTIENLLALWPQGHEVARAVLAQRRVQLAEAELNLEYTVIKAPFAGRVSERLVETGQFVGVGAALARIYESNVMEIPIRVPLDDFTWIDSTPFLRPEKPGGSPPAGPRAEVRLRSGEAVWRWTGRVSRVDGQIDRATRTAGLVVEVDARARIDSGAPANRTPPELMPGLFVEVEVEGRRAPSAIALPRGAIDQDGRVKLAVEGRLELRPVHVLRVSGDQAFVDKGLEDGDLVVLSPMSTPVDGMALKVAAERPIQTIADGEGGSS